MKISNQIKELLKLQGITITELAELLNTSQGNMTNKLSRDNFRLSELNEITKVLGFNELTISLSNGDKCYEISNMHSELIELEDTTLQGSTPSTYKKLLEVYGHSGILSEDRLKLLEDLLTSLLKFQVKLNQFVYAHKTMPDVFGAEDTFDDYLKHRREIEGIVDEIYKLHVGSYTFDDLLNHFGYSKNTISSLSKSQKED